MSYHLFVYTPELSLEKVTFSIEMLNRGQRVVYLPEGAFSENVEATFLPDHGKLEGSQMIAAWGTDEKRANALEDIVAGQDLAGLRNTAVKGSGLAFFSLSVVPFTFPENPANDAPDVLLKALSAQDREKILPKPQFEALLATRFEYHLRTSAEQSPLSLELQETAWKAIAKLTGGLTENPQTADVSLGEPVPKLNFFQYWFQKITTPGI